MSRLSDGAFDQSAHNISQPSESMQDLNATEKTSSFSEGKLWTPLTFTASTLKPCESAAQKCNDFFKSKSSQDWTNVWDFTSFDDSLTSVNQFCQVSDQKPERKVASDCFFESVTKSAVCESMTQPLSVFPAPTPLKKGASLNASSASQGQSEQIKDPSFLKAKAIERLGQFQATLDAYSQQPLRDDATRSNYAKLLEHYATQAQADDIGEATEYRLTVSEKLLENSSDILQGLRKKCKVPESLGVNIQGLDESLIADRSMHVRYVKSPEGEFTRADLDLTRFGRQNLEATHKAIENNPDEFAQVLKQRGYGNATVKRGTYSYVTNDQNVFTRKHIGNGIEIRIEGLGAVYIPQDCKALEKRISFEVPTGSTNEEEKKLAQLMSVVGLSSAAFEANGMDCIKCQKLMTLFRSFYPSQSYALEEEGLSQDPERLKEQILQATPEMGAIFEQYQDGEMLKKEERVIGKSTYTIPDMSTRLHQAGARALIAGIGSIDGGHGLQTLKTIFNNGSLSSKARFDAGLLISGASSVQDHTSGGAGHVFTRMLTQAHRKTNDKVQNLLFSGEIQLLFDLETTNAASTAYAYLYDQFGTKHNIDYQQRDNLIQFAQTLDQLVAQGDSHLLNEVMIKERIPPNHIKGVVVQSEKHRDAVIATLKGSGHVVDEKINGVPLDQFVQVAINLSQLDTRACFSSGQMA